MTIQLERDNKSSELASPNMEVGGLDLRSRALQTRGAKLLVGIAAGINEGNVLPWEEVIKSEIASLPDLEKLQVWEEAQMTAETRLPFIAGINEAQNILWKTIEMDMVRIGKGFGQDEEAHAMARTAIGFIHDRYYEREVKYGQRHGLSRAEAEDVAADTFLSVMEHIQSYEPSGPFSAWISVITRNEVNDRLRKEVRKNEVPIFQNGEDEIGGQEDPEIEANTNNHDENWVEHAAHQLGSEKQRKVVFYRYRDGMSVSETALRMGTTEHAVKKLAERGLQNLRGVVIRDGDSIGVVQPNNGVDTNEGVLQGRISSIRTTEDIRPLGARAFVVHLTHQRVINIGAVQTLLEQNPQLRVIEVTSSRIRQIGPNIRNILADHGVKLSIMRRHESSAYDRTDRLFRGFYDDKLAVFRNASEDPNKKELLLLLRDHGFMEVKALDYYFSDPRISVREVANRLGVDYFAAKQSIDALLVLLGFHTEQKEALKAARRLEARINKIKEADLRQKAEQEALKREFGVGDRVPPPTLPKDRWSEWKAVMTIITENPSRYNALQEQEPRNYSILVDYLQLDTSTPPRISLKDIGEKYGLNRERIRQIKNETKEKLGIKTSKKQSPEANTSGVIYT